MESQSQTQLNVHALTHGERLYHVGLCSIAARSQQFATPSLFLCFQEDPWVCLTVVKQLRALKTSAEHSGTAGLYCLATKDLCSYGSNFGKWIPLPPTPSAGLGFASYNQSISPASVIFNKFSWEIKNSKWEQNIHLRTSTPQNLVVIIPSSLSPAPLLSLSIFNTVWLIHS